MISNDVTVTARLLSQAAEGNCIATVELFDGELGEMYETACLLLGDTGGALEMVRQTVSAAVDKLGEVEDASQFSYWTRTLVVRSTIQHMVARGIPFLDADPGTDKPMPEERWVDWESSEILEFVLSTVRSQQTGTNEADDSFQRMLRLQLQSLPDDLRVAFVLHDLLGFCANETSMFLGVTPEDTKKLLAAARHKLVTGILKALRSMAATMRGSDDMLTGREKTLGRAQSEIEKAVEFTAH